MWAERSDKSSRLPLSSIYGSPAHRSVPAPMTSRSRSAHAPFDFLNPIHRFAHLTFLPAPLPLRTAPSPLHILKPVSEIRFISQIKEWIKHYNIIRRY